jgi:hypothetical protein
MLTIVEAQRRTKLFLTGQMLEALRAVEFVNFARHLCRREPVDKGGRIQEGRAELLGPGPDDPRCASRGANMLFGHVAALARGRADQTAAAPCRSAGRRRLCV